MAETKLWGGRFSCDVDPVMESFNASIGYDKKMWKQDIRGSIAYAKSLNKVGILTDDETQKIESGLQQVEVEWASGSFQIQGMDEDIHTANERRLKEIIGSDIGGKLHTGRSRNDQVATDTRLWLLDYLIELEQHLKLFLITVVENAEQQIDVLLPGYTHLQRGQAVRWSHWILSYACMLKRDLERFSDAKKRVSLCPLGSGALAGNPFGIDRLNLSKGLGFDDITWNSMDGVSARDFITEFQWCASMCAVHLSKFAEDLIIYSSKEFGFVTLSDAYSTGSSLMPQKKNPDSLELIRGKAGRIQGQTVGFMMTIKGTPSTYNKDLQEDKQSLFDVCDTLRAVVQIATGVVATMKVNADACSAALSPDMLATDLAYYLVRRGRPFRDAHSASGRCVVASEERGCRLDELTLQELKTVDDLFEEDVSKLWDYKNSVDQYTAIGGTAKSAVQDQINKFKVYLKE